MLFLFKCRLLISFPPLLLLVIAFSIQISQVNCTCTDGCDLALGSYHIWAASNLTFIASFFSIPVASIRSVNREYLGTDVHPDILLVGSRINIPFTCSCINGSFLTHVFSYTITPGITYGTVAKLYYSNLTSPAWLQRFNGYQENRIPDTGVLNVPVNCSCGDKVFITWPIRVEDTLESVAAANNLTIDTVRRYNPNANFTAEGGLLYIPVEVNLFRADPPSPALGPSGREKRAKSNWKLKLSIGAGSSFLAAVTLLVLFSILRRKIGGPGLGAPRKLTSPESVMHRSKGDDESLFFSFPSIEIATNHFSEAKKLGQGGFGPVYKGKLDNGLEIAVKRLNRMTVHGTEQFRNEVTVISRVQHRNLVRLLGYCTDREERLLIYEYLPNKSLDSILFDAANRHVLDWKGRLKIIEGIAQGLLYLHKYSRLKIIHRDLKASNVLLDKELNPKISDFGTARIIGENEMRANTNKIVGTYGYMSPEYAMDGIFSEKSDVFSFGVMILEIISGKKNTAFYDSDRHLNLIGHVWDLWTEGRISEIADSTIRETILMSEVLKYVQVGLLCVQEKAADRPTMSDVASMLFNESIALNSPKRPAFSEIIGLNNTNLSESPEYCSFNKVTISDVEGR